MRTVTLAMTLLGGCLAALPALADDPPKNADGGTFAPGDYTGKMVSTPGTDGAFTVAVENDRLVAKPGAAQSVNRELQQLQKDQEHIDKLQAELARSRNLKQYEHRLSQLNEAMARMQTSGLKDKLKAGGDVQVVKEQKDVDFRAADGVKVRTLNPPMQFDDKGNPKKYTPKELDALKGKDKDLPGYEAAPDSLKVGDMVKVTLAAPPKSDKTGADKDPDPPAKAGNQVTVILILSEPADGGNGKGK